MPEQIVVRFSLAVSFLLVVSSLSSICFVSASSRSANHGATLRSCDRGYCTRKKEEPLDPNAFHAAQFNNKHNLPNSHNKKRRSFGNGGIDFCSTSSTSSYGDNDEYVVTTECELYHILGAEVFDEEFEALECPKGQKDCGIPPLQKKRASDDNDNDNDDIHKKTTTTTIIVDEGYIELDDYDDEISNSDHNKNESLSAVSSRSNSKRAGLCVDNESGYTFDCNLVEILNDGTVLVEDLREGGVFAAQPKSNFTLSSKKQHTKIKTRIRTPNVILADDPCEDFRTNVFLNMEGI